MKNKIKHILLILTYLFISSIPGCDHHQDNQAIYVQGLYMYCELDPDYPEDQPRPDCWLYEGEGGLNTNTYLAGFGFILRLLDEDGNPFAVPGIRFDVEVTWHGPVSYGSEADIWERKAPNGKNYGGIKVFPEAGSGTFDDVVYGRTNSMGAGRIVVRLGGSEEAISDPNHPIDYGWEWPDLSGMVVETGVELKVTIRRPAGQHVTQYFWAYFFRGQFQGFWDPYGGIYEASIQGIGEFPELFEMQMILANLADNSMSNVPLVNEILISPSAFTADEEKTPKDRAIRYAFPARERNFPESVTRISGKGMMGTLSNGMTIDQIDFTQLRWACIDPPQGHGCDWYYFYVELGESLHPLFCDPNDPNDILGLLHDAEPYCWWTYLTLPEPFDANSGKCTAFLRAVDDFGVYDPNMQLPIYSYFYDMNASQVLLQSEWWVPSEDPNFHGYYEDEWGNPFIALYMPSATHPVLHLPDTYGDFNADGNVDWKNLGLFSEQYLDVDPNTRDWRFKDPNNWNKDPVNFREFSAFAENWGTNDQ